MPDSIPPLTPTSKSLSLTISAPSRLSQAPKYDYAATIKTAREHNPQYKNLSDTQVLQDLYKKYPGFRGNIINIPTTTKAAKAVPVKVSSKNVELGTLPPSVESGPELPGLLQNLYGLTLKPSVDHFKQAQYLRHKYGLSKDPTDAQGKSMGLDAFSNYIGAIPFVGPAAYSIEAASHKSDIASELGQLGLSLAPIPFGEGASVKAASRVAASAAKREALSKVIPDSLVGTRSAGERSESPTLQETERFASSALPIRKQFSKFIGKRSDLMKQHLQNAFGLIHNATEDTKNILSNAAQKLEAKYRDAASDLEQDALNKFGDVGEDVKNTGNELAEKVSDAQKKMSKAAGEYWERFDTALKASGLNVDTTNIIKTLTKWMHQNKVSAKVLFGGLPDFTLGENVSAARLFGGDAAHDISSLYPQDTLDKAATVMFGKSKSVIDPKTKVMVVNPNRDPVSFDSLTEDQQNKVLVTLKPKISAADARTLVKSLNNSIKNNPDAKVISKAVLRDLHHQVEQAFNTALDHDPSLKALYEAGKKATTEKYKAFNTSYLQQILRSKAPLRGEAVIKQAWASAKNASDLVRTLGDDQDSIAGLRRHTLAHLFHDYNNPEAALKELTDPKKGYGEIFGLHSKGTFDRVKSILDKRVQDYEETQQGAWAKFLHSMSSENPQQQIDNLLSDDADGSQAKRMIRLINDTSKSPQEAETVKRQVGNHLLTQMLDKVTSNGQFFSKDGLFDPVAFNKSLEANQGTIKTFYGEKAFDNLQKVAKAFSGFTLNNIRENDRAARFGAYTTIHYAGYLVGGALFSYSSKWAAGALIGLAGLPSLFMKVAMNDKGADWLVNGLYKKDAAWAASGIAIVSELAKSNKDFRDEINAQRQELQQQQQSRNADSNAIGSVY